MTHTTEDQFRAEAAKAQLKIAALDWLDSKSQDVPKYHTDQCNYMDDTGWPAPCSCAYGKNEDVKIISLLKQLLMKT